MRHLIIFKPEIIFPMKMIYDFQLFARKSVKIYFSPNRRSASKTLYVTWGCDSVGKVVASNTRGQRSNLEIGNF